MDAGQIDGSFEEFLPECNLPADLMVIILTNLPVKSLLRFKAVSKPWCSFISSPRFVKLHLRRQSVAYNNLLLWSDQCIYGLLTNIHEKNNTFVDSDVLVLESSPISKCLSSSGVIPNYVIGSSNGLVALCSVELRRHGDVFLWNPATRKCRRIQLPDGYFRLSFSSLGLYYDEATNDFKIVGWADTHRNIQRPSLFVYTLSCDSWKKWDWICDDAQKSPNSFGYSTIIGGSMNWLSCTSRSNSKSVITAFDVKDGAVSFFGVPDIDYRAMTVTLPIRGCISIVDLRYTVDMESELDVWIMEEYGVEKSWVKRFTVWEPTLVMSPLTCWNEGEMVVLRRNAAEDSKTLTFHDLFNSKKSFLEFKSFPFALVSSYVESFVSVGTAQEDVEDWSNSIVWQSFSSEA